MSVHDFFKKSDVDLKGLSKYLDEMESSKRITEVRSLNPGEQALLFDAAEGFLPLSLGHYVPSGTPPLKQVIHYGRNSLPLFSIFEKRFCCPDPKIAKNVLWGYNEQAFKLFTGPGYFVAKQASEKEVVFDYCEIPPQNPPGWPRILPNSARLGRFVYYNMKDYMRGVSKHVSIGRATRDGKVMNNWFVLCREG